MTLSEPVKIVFWDLDGTLWQGTLEEDAEEATIPFTLAKHVIYELDKRGILNSIVSQASQGAANAKLMEHNLADLFIHPKFEVISKAQAINNTLQELNLLPRNAAFIDDLPFHRAEVTALLPDVLVASPSKIRTMLDSERFTGTGTLGPSRRQMYQAEELREKAQRIFTGSRADFLRGCNMKLACGQVDATDERLTELFARTHRLSSLPAGTDEQAFTVGNTYNLETEPRKHIPNYKMISYTARLQDRFGDYGVIAGATVRRYTEEETGEDRLCCERLAVSCRVQGRGVLEAFLWWLVQKCTSVQVEFYIPVNIASDVNQPMRMALRFCGFAPLKRYSNYELLALKTPERLAIPEWIQVEAKSGSSRSQ